MKKLLLTLVFSFLYITSASAGVSVGVSGNAGLFSASGNESTGSTVKGNGSEHGSAGWGSIFVEGTFQDKIMIGIDYVPYALETDTVETAKSNTTHAAAAAAVDTASTTTVTNKLQVDFENLTTLYAGFMIGENFFVKAGLTAVDVKTNENLATGASYTNQSLDGSMIGLGYHNNMDNGMFFRFEGNYMSFDGTTMKSSGTGADSTIALDNLDGISGKLSLGKTF